MRVVKLGGRVQSDAALPAVLAAAWRESAALVVVHGGGDEVSALQAAFGRQSQFVDGKRVTATEDLELLRMALSGSANKRLVAALVGAGLPAVGISGEDAGMLQAAAETRETLGEVGTPSQVDATLMQHLLSGGFCPVVSPLARDRDSQAGGVLNVNGDDAAAAIAVALHADELLLVSDVAGVLVDGAALTQLDADGARELMVQGIARGGMAAKLEAALGALQRGVARVRIGDVSALTDATHGTVITLAGVSA
ncbi:MAG TPA: acetylglutamate kinase [Gemmatimonadaceae bacterium]|nr:acetylglutamate kinase [Gemmatimonadaceae bacterium]